MCNDFSYSTPDVGEYVVTEELVILSLSVDSKSPFCVPNLNPLDPSSGSKR